MEIAFIVMEILSDVMDRVAIVMEILFVVMREALFVMERTFIIGYKRLSIVDLQPVLAYLQFIITDFKPNVCVYERYSIDFKQSLHELGQINSDTESTTSDNEAKHYDSIQNLHELQVIVCVYQVSSPNRQHYLPE